MRINTEAIHNKAAFLKEMLHKKDISHIMEALKSTGVEKKKILRAAVWAIVPLVFIFGAYTAFSRFTSYSRAVEVKKEDIARFKALQEEYLKKKAVTDTISKRSASADSESIVNIIENTGARTGVKNRITSIKPLEEREVSGFMDREAEVKIEGVDLNQAVNLVYQIENNKALLIVKEFSMKSRFDNPELLDLKIRLSYLKKAEETYMPPVFEEEQ